MDFVVLFAQFTSFQEPNDLRLLRFFFFFLFRSFCRVSGKGSKQKCILFVKLQKCCLESIEMFSLNKNRNTAKTLGRIFSGVPEHKCFVS